MAEITAAGLSLGCPGGKVSDFPPVKAIGQEEDPHLVSHRIGACTRSDCCTRYRQNKIPQNKPKILFSLV